jgi:hypothetical protein
MAVVTVAGPIICPVEVVRFCGSKSRGELVFVFKLGSVVGIGVAGYDDVLGVAGYAEGLGIAGYDDWLAGGPNVEGAEPGAAGVGLIGGVPNAGAPIGGAVSAGCV